MAESRNNPLCKVGESFDVDMETGEAVPVEGGGAWLLPGPPGSCEWCHVHHDPRHAHDLNSLPYQMRFNAVHGRWPTWTDAMAHCSPELQAFWRRELILSLESNGLPVPDDLRAG